MSMPQPEHAHPPDKVMVLQLAGVFSKAVQSHQNKVLHLKLLFAIGLIKLGSK